MATIEDQFNHFAVRVNNGSGCIFQPDTENFTYVLTVRHNLQKEQPPGSGEKVLCSLAETQVVRSSLYGGAALNVQSFHVSEDHDIALIVVGYIGAYADELMHANPQRDEKLRIFGFPNVAAGSALNTSNIICTCDLVQVPDVQYEVVAEPILHSFNQGAPRNVIGFSGSGIFAIAGERLILKGIFPSLRLEDGALNKLNAFYINPFNSLALANGLQELVPYGMCSFRQYEEMALNNVSKPIRNTLKGHITNIIDSPLTPLLVSDAIKGNLSVPYTKNYRDLVNNPRLWKSWLDLLTFLDIVTEHPVYTLQTFLRNVRLYHSQHKMVIEDMIMELLLDQPSMDAVSDNDIIAFSGKEPSANKYLSKERVAKIVGSIYLQGNEVPGIQIDKADKHKSFCCIDIEHFADRMATIDPSLSPGEIRELIRAKILQILNYGNN